MRSGAGGQGLDAMPRLTGIQSVPQEPHTDVGMNTGRHFPAGTGSPLELEEFQIQGAKRRWIWHGLEGAQQFAYSMHCLPQYEAAVVALMPHVLCITMESKIKLLAEEKRIAKKVGS